MVSILGMGKRMDNVLGVFILCMVSKNSLVIYFLSI